MLRRLLFFPPLQLRFSWFVSWSFVCIWLSCPAFGFTFWWVLVGLSSLDATCALSELVLRKCGWEAVCVCIIVIRFVLFVRHVCVRGPKPELLLEQLRQNQLRCWAAQEPKSTQTPAKIHSGHFSGSRRVPEHIYIPLDSKFRANHASGLTLAVINFFLPQCTLAGDYRIWPQKPQEYCKSTKSRKNAWKLLL